MELAHNPHWPWIRPYGIPSCITDRPLNEIWYIGSYIPNFIQIEETFCGRTDVRTDIFPPLILLGRLLEVDLKMTQRYLYTVYEESGIPSRTTCKKAKLDEVLAAHCRADLVTECMKKKKNTHKYYQVTFVFVFRLKMNVHFRLRPKIKKCLLVGL